MPRAAASMYTRNPRPTPPSETIAARRPWQIERDTRYIMLGPGVSDRPRQSNANPNNADVAGKTDSVSTAPIARYLIPVATCSYARNARFRTVPVHDRHTLNTTR